MNTVASPKPTDDSSEPSPPPGQTVQDPCGEYERRLAERESSVSQARALDGRLATLRGLLFLALAATLFFSFATPVLPAWAAILPAALFAGAVAYHTIVVRKLDQAQRAVRYYERGIARLEHRWSDFGATGQRYSDPHHLYTADLDIFGRGSLFQLISTARTRLGEDTLAEWLSKPAEADEIRGRQESIAELRPAADLREEFALLDAEVHDELDQNQLRLWAREAARPIAAWRRVVAIALASATIASIICWYFGYLRMSWCLILLLAESLFLASLRKRIQAIAAALDKTASGLTILAQVLRIIEQLHFQTPRLRRLRSHLDTEGQPPSVRIAQLNTRIQYLDNALKNQFFAPIAFLACLPLHLVHAIESWKTRYAAVIPQWLDAVGEFEALSAVAGYAFERPGDVVPEITTGSFRLEATALGHPLISEASCVRNDLSIGDELRLVMISGSNMSGKSTMLRTVGANVVLALCGAPVCASSMTISPVATGTSMRVHDSLQDGESLFYSVVSRLKSVVNLADGELPLLFLLDEILQGTNSHDRRIGAEGIIRQLVKRNAVGLVTTHDLALTNIVDSFGNRAVNRHFEDRIVEGRMSFDYKIRPGVITRTNALELMRMVGLDVDTENPQSTSNATE